MKKNKKNENPCKEMVSRKVRWGALSLKCQQLLTDETGNSQQLLTD
jgi:hypothetical protein